LDERALAEGRVRDEERAVEDAALDEAEAQLPEFLAVDADDSEDDEDYTPTIFVPPSCSRRQGRFLTWSSPCTTS